MSLADWAHVATIVMAVCLVLLVIIVPIASPRKIAQVVLLLTEIRDQGRESGGKK